MLQAFLRSLFGRREPAATQRERLHIADWPAAIYAIGDVHGCLHELKQLERRIYADGTAIKGEKWIVMLGDYVDRGPDSAGVIEHLLSPVPPRYRRICLAGNHDALMLDYIDQPSPEAEWIGFGGDKALRSYGVDEDEWVQHSGSIAQMRQVLDRHIPRRHVDFLRQLALYLRVGNTVFVHAGLRHGVPLEQQSERDLLWMRPANDGPFADGMRVVHGHTPAATPTLLPWRIGVDTGAAKTGVLTAVRLMQNGEPAILQTGN